MKILVIGCGGIGSHFVDEAVRQIEIGQLNAEIVIADDDIIEPQQLSYQSFRTQDVGLNKAECKRKHHVSKQGIEITALRKRIRNQSQIKGYDFIVLCVDNEPARTAIIKTCHEINTPFLDLRSSGRKIIATPKLQCLPSNMKFIDQDDTNEYSCQEKSDIAKGHINIGNKIVALIGVQMLLNHTRGHTNIPQSLSM